MQVRYQAALRPDVESWNYTGFNRRAPGAGEFLR
jgi:hypothetical protein